MQGFAIALGVIDIIICIALIALVIVQEGNSQGLGSLGGNTETFFSKNKGRAFDNQLKKFTSILAVAFGVVTIVLFALTSV